MRTFTLFLLIATSVYLGSCDSKKKKRTGNNSNDPATLEQASTVKAGFLFKEIKGENASLKLEILPFDKNNIPAVMKKYKGKLVNGAHWRDKNGEQWLLLTETGEMQVKKGKTDEKGNLIEDPDTRAEAHAYFWVKKHDSYVTYRKDQWIEDCGPLDVLAEFHKKGFTITDVNKNGWAEITLTYKHYCRSDVSPASLTLRMIEQDKMYEMFGTCDMKMGSQKEAPVMKGKRKEGTFAKAPAAFKNHINQIWEKVKLEKLY